MGIFDFLFGDGGRAERDRYYREREERMAREAAAETQRQREEQQAADLRQTNITRRGQAVDTARSGAGSYFSGLGLDPSQFEGDINQRIQEALSYTAEDDPNVGQYFGDLGKSVYEAREGQARNKATRDVDLAFGPDYASHRISDQFDDPILSAINQEQRGKADEYVNNLLKRGVITEGGRQAASRGLDEQGARVKTILDELGRSTLESGRSRLGDIANRGRSAASSLTLGSNFDPSFYTGEADKAFGEFSSTLGDTLRGSAPTDLYDTSGLANLAGVAQGQTPTKFDPKALAGIIEPDDKEEDPNAPSKKVAF